MQLVRKNITEVSYAGTIEMNGEKVINIFSTFDSNNVNKLKITKECHLRQYYWEEATNCIIDNEFVTKSNPIIIDGKEGFDLYQLETDLERLTARSKYFELSTGEQ